MEVNCYFPCIQITLIISFQTNGRIFHVSDDTWSWNRTQYLNSNRGIEQIITFVLKDVGNQEQEKVFEQTA